MAHAGQLRIVGGQLQKGVAGGHQRVVAVAGVVLKLHIEAGGAAQPADGRRAAGKDARLFNLVKGFGRPFDNGKGGAAGGVPLLPVLQAHEHSRHVLAVAAGAGADGGEHRFDVGLLVLKEVVFGLLHHLQRLLLRRAGGQLHRGGEHPAIFLRQERGRQVHKQEHHPAQQQDVDHYPAQRTVQNFAYR